MDTAVIHLSCVTPSAVALSDSHYDRIISAQLFSHRPSATPHLDYQRGPPLTHHSLSHSPEHARPGPRLTEVGACELGQDAEGAGLGGAGAGLPVLSVLDQPLLAAVIGDKTGQVLHPEAIPAHTPSSSIRQAAVNTIPSRDNQLTPTQLIR